MSEPIVTTAKLAEILGVESDDIRNRTKDGDLVAVGRGKYALGPTIRAYIEALLGAKDIRRLNEELLEEKVKQTRAQRLKAEYELEQLQKRQEDREARTRSVAKKRGKPAGRAAKGR